MSTLKKIAKKIVFFLYFSLCNRNFIYFSDESEPLNQSREELDLRVNKFISLMKRTNIRKVRVICSDETYLLQVTILSWAIISNFIIIDTSKIKGNPIILGEVMDLIRNISIPSTVIKISGDSYGNEDLIVPNGIVLLPKKAIEKSFFKGQMIGSNLHGDRLILANKSGILKSIDAITPEVSFLDFRTTK